MRTSPWLSKNRDFPWQNLALGESYEINDRSMWRINRHAIYRHNKRYGGDGLLSTKVENDKLIIWRDGDIASQPAKRQTLKLRFPS